MLCSSHSYTFPSQVCFGNGQQVETGYNTYVGSVQIDSLINEPAVFEITSVPGETLAVSRYDDLDPLIHHPCSSSSMLRLMHMNTPVSILMWLLVKST